MDIASNNINQNQLNQNNSYNNTGINNLNSNYQGTSVDNNYMNNNKNGTSFTNGMINQPNGNMVHSTLPQYIPQNNNQNFWNGNYNMSMQNIQQSPAQPNIQNQNEKEFILLDGSAPNKKRKYVFVEEIDVTQPVFSLEDIRKIVSDEFDRRFGEEEKK